MISSEEDGYILIWGNAYIESQSLEVLRSIREHQYLCLNHTIVLAYENIEKKDEAKNIFEFLLERVLKFISAKSTTHFI